MGKRKKKMKEPKVHFSGSMSTKNSGLPKNI